ncbi:TPA: TRASH domain-containing protein [Bacillus cereus]|nr:TRASH domain-containing protein [Bacillus cereus]MBJ8037724.1 TRASH domain-containing protein [Bacillus cereus]MDR4151128.1 TRASH domain-containing protein [Bacillus thuringiensis]MDR5021823.1 TRASH domain-containing protein [Bacillus thuringiensis]HDR6243716.1 TRASH domain-containing protein [Bacillus cereus]
MINIPRFRINSSRHNSLYFFCCKPCLHHLVTIFSNNI